MFRHIALGVLMVSGIAILGIGRSGAADQTITCDQQNCFGANGPLFSETKLAPNQVIKRSLTLRNDFSSERKFGITITGFDTNGLAPELTIRIKRQATGQVVYGPQTLQNWKNTGLIPLEVVPPNTQEVYDFEVTLSDVPNKYQNKEISFDLDLGIETVEPDPSVGVGGAETGLVLGKMVGKILGTNDEVFEPEILGTTQSCQRTWWWWPLVVQLIVGLVWAVLSSSRSKMTSLMGLLGLAIISQFVHIFIGCDCSVLCRWYWLINIGIMLILFSPRLFPSRRLLKI